MSVEITKDNYDKVVKESNKLILLDFYATWCGPCKTISPILDELSNEYADTVTIGKVDVDENGDINSEYGIRAVPTVLFIKDGVVVNKILGAKLKSEFKEIIDANL
jgi:thioredoxin 1